MNRSRLRSVERTTSGSELFVRVDRTSGLPVRLQLEHELRRAVQTGRLAAGIQMPSTRALAADLQLSRGVVVEAYEQLLAEGYLISQAGSGTRVAGRGPVADPVAAPEPITRTPRFDFRPGLPDLALFPRRAWLSAMRRAFAHAPHDAFDYPDPRGVEAARAALAAYLNRARATVARSDRMLFCSGSAQGIGLVCRVLRDRGARRVAVEDPGHADQCTDIQATGLETPRIPVDRDGLRVDRLIASGADAVLVTPAHQYPTGAVLSAERRAALLDWADQRQAFIIEDDYDAEYRYDRSPLGALQGLAPGRVIYVGSASKVLSPALRLGWMAVPADLVAELATAKLQADRGSAALEQLAFAELLNRGDFDRHLRRTRQIYRRRRDALVAELRRRRPDLHLHGVAAGLHLMIDLPGDADEDAIVEEAARQSIRVYGSRPYRSSRRKAAPALIVGYGGLPESKIRAGVERLVAVLENHTRVTRRSLRTQHA